MTELRAELTRNLTRFREEATTVFNELVLPQWGGELHGFSETLYAYMARSFSYVDLLSTYWGESKSGAQSVRMVDFMDRYFGYHREAHSVAVKLWRHTLIHTARPRPLRHASSGKTVLWLLHWHEQHLPREQHFTFAYSDDRQVLNIGVLCLLEDVERAAIAYLDECDDSPVLRERAVAAHRRLNSETFRSY